MKTGKLITAGIAAYLFDIITGMICTGLIFNRVYKIEANPTWQLSECVLPVFFFVGAIILSMALALVYALLKDSIPGKNRYTKGLILGLLIWAVGVLPSMLAVLSFMAIEPLAIGYWIFLSLAHTPLKCVIISSIYGE